MLIKRFLILLASIVIFGISIYVLMTTQDTTNEGNIKTVILWTSAVLSGINVIGTILGRLFPISMLSFFHDVDEFERKFGTYNEHETDETWLAGRKMQEDDLKRLQRKLAGKGKRVKNNLKKKEIQIQHTLFVDENVAIDDVDHFGL